MSGSPAQAHVHVGEVVVLVKVFCLKREFVFYPLVGESYCCLNRLGLTLWRQGPHPAPRCFLPAGCLVTLEDAQNSPKSELCLPNLVERHEATGVTGRRICPSGFKNSCIFFNGIFLGAARSLQECTAQLRCC